MAETPAHQIVAPQSVAGALVAALLAQGVRRVFCVPGESYLSVLDALYATQGAIEVIVCRHEAGAANMAEAHGKLTGEPGVCFVTRGPGATHASIGVHTARQDSTPMILFIGQVAAADKEREAFQEVDYRAFFGPLAKWATELERPDRVSELVERAFATALSGRQGPVVMALPEDILDQPALGPAPAKARPPRGGLTPAFVEALGERLQAAQKPLLVLGGSGWDEGAVQALEGFVSAASLPTVCSFRRKHLLNNDHPCFVGDLGLGPNPKLIARVKEADLVIALGARLGENPSQAYTLFTREEARAKLVHIHPDPEELGRVWPNALSAAADMPSAVGALAGLCVDGARWAAWREDARSDYEAFTRPLPDQGRVNLAEVYAHLAEALPADSIITNGAGNYAAWLHRFYRHRAFRTQLAPTSGAMGYGLPASIAAKLEHPDRTVVCAAGDGCLMMIVQELATAAQYGAAIIVLVIDNGSYGTIRMHQERHFPGRVMATDLANPDFAALAQACGFFAVKVDETAEFPSALAAARASGRPSLIHLKTDVEQIGPGRTITALRSGA
jgi:acetolactate synthase-1/2/3 large subunit